MKDIKILKRQSVYLIIMSFLVLGVLTSYALGAFEAVLKGNQVSSVSTCSLDISFVDTNPVTLLAGIPIDDVDANDYDPYIVTVKNNNSNCKNVNYVLKMNSLCDNCEKTDGKCSVGENTCNCNDDYQIDSGLIKYSVKNVESGVVTTGSDPYKNLKLRGTIANVGDSANYEIKMWISKDAINSDIYVSNGSGGYLEDSNGHYITKDFCSKIKLDVDTKKTLVDAIMAQNIVTTGNGLYMSTATDDGKPTYYYRGNVENNYVDFAGHTWRVVRINDDGTIKMILQNTINNKTYCINKNNYSVYEYMYYSNSKVTDGVMKIVDDWYNSVLAINYDSYIATTNFCESARVKVSSSYTSGNAIMELSKNYISNFECPADSNGKQYVISKVGLITADEVAMAGVPLYTGSQINNVNTYLQNGISYWTMTPAGYDTVARVWYVKTDGYSYGNGVNTLQAVRPVISLNSNVSVSGLGTASDMWKVLP